MRQQKEIKLYIKKPGMFSKRILLLVIATTILAGLLKAQTKNDYEANWKQVEAFDKKGLPKSALQVVMKIFQLATKEGNDAQLIKSSIYQVKYRQMLEQDSRENNIFFIDRV